MISSLFLANCGCLTNAGEADLVVHHIKSLLNAGVLQKDIAVIAPYSLQVSQFAMKSVLIHVVLWVRVPPKAAHFSFESDCLGCAVLLCLVVCLTLLASFFLHSASHVHNSIPCMYMSEPIQPPILD